MNNRLQQFLELENITPARLADILGVQRSGLSHILSGRNKPGFEFITKILTKFPRVNPDWLLLGKGKPYRDMNSENSATPLPSEKVQRGNQYDSIQYDSILYDKRQYNEIQYGDIHSNGVQSRDIQSDDLQYVNSGNFDTDEQFSPEFEIYDTEQNMYQNSTNEIVRPKSTQSQPAENRVNGQNKGVIGQKKRVKRVIIFYNDGSFEELFPHIR